MKHANKTLLQTFALIGVVFNTMIGHAIAGTGSNLPYLEEVKLVVKGGTAGLLLENQSKSGKLSDFKVKTLGSYIKFTGVEGKLTCGVHSVGMGYPDKASKGDGAPRLHFGLVNGNIKSSNFSVDRSVFKPSVFHRKGLYKYQGHEKMSSGNGPITFQVPISKLKKSGLETSFDAIALFNSALQKHINNGGSKIDFLRNNQTIQATAFLSFEAGCHSVFKRVAYATEKVMISMKYRGDKTLKYLPTVKLGGTGTIQQPLQVTAAKIAVTPANSTGQCPRKVTANAELTFNHAPNTPRTYQVRFLEDGKVVSDWKKLPLINKTTAKIQHQITVTEPKGKAAQSRVKMPQAFTSSLGIKAESNVTVEVKVDGKSKKTAFTLYQANCTPPISVGVASLSNDKKPDLTSRKGIKIGNKSAQWGGKIILNKADFTNASERGCRARFLYDVVNIGQANASGFNSRLRLNGKQIHLQNNMAVTKNQSKDVSGTVLLPAGTYPVTVSIDDGKAVGEIKENNNNFKVMVTVPNSCGGSTTPRS